MKDVDPLTRLAIRHGTDKWGMHFYTPTYHQLFAHLRDRPIRLLEIGVGGYGWQTAGGASVAMWAEYFPKGEIVGLDIVDKKVALGPRITLRQGSQEDPAVLARLCDELGPFDIVIDDGSHVPAHVVKSFETLFPRMADHGLYVIEDVQTCFWPRFGGSVADGGATMRLASSILQHLHHAEIKVAVPDRETPSIARQIRSMRAFHNLLVVERGDNDEPSNFAFSMENPHAALALESIERELERAPTARGFTNLAVFLAASGARPRAESVVRDALERWPESSDLLMIAMDIVVDQPERLALLERLARIEPEASSPTVERIRAAIVKGESTMSVCAGLEP